MCDINVWWNQLTDCTCEPLVCCAGQVSPASLFDYFMHNSSMKETRRTERMKVFTTHNYAQAFPCRANRGVLETLHILDMSQGLTVDSNAAAPQPASGKKQKRVTAIVEQSPSVAEKKQDTSPTSHPPADMGKVPGSSDWCPCKGRDVPCLHDDLRTMTAWQLCIL